MTKRIDVLDHGYVVLNNLAGPTRRPDAEFDASDVDVANVARMSFGASNQGRTYDDEMKLNRFLAQHEHMGPFEQIVVWLEMKLPIFVARQFVRHRTASLNEVSGRYVELPEEWYVRPLHRFQRQPENKKQGGVLVDLSKPEDLAFAMRRQAAIIEDCQRSYQAYREAITDGMAYEQARDHLHLNHYTRWVWCQDLRNLFHLLALRDHSGAQWESQEYARAIIQLLEPRLPGLMRLFEEFWRQ